MRIKELFDRSLLRRRRARFAGETAEHEFLLSHVAAEIAERIGAILRDFPLALDLGAYHGLSAAPWQRSPPSAR